MSNRTPLMPKATAVWLVENTSLTFDQVAEFCGLHHLEVKGIADGDVAQGIKGMDPIASGQLSREEIKRGEADSEYRLRLQESKVEIPIVKTKRGPRYTPVSRRQDRPDAIAWFLRNHPEITDAQISKILGTTKATIDQVRDRTHWNAANIKPVDPVTLGLVGQLELDALVRKAADKAAKDAAKRAPAGATLRPASEAGEPQEDAVDDVEDDVNEAANKVDLDDVFAPSTAHDDEDED